MKGPRRLAPLVLTSLALAGAGGLPWAAAGEESVQLKDAPGRDLSTGRCIICHSLEYIPSNAPAMNRAAIHPANRRTLLPRSGRL
jgi:mono/diheme cytochrome c family protein